MKTEVNAVKHGSHPSAFTLPYTPSLTVGLPPKFITARADNETPDALAPRRFLRGRRAIFRRDARVGRRKLFLFLRARVGSARVGGLARLLKSLEGLKLAVGFAPAFESRVDEEELVVHAGVVFVETRAALKDGQRLVVALEAHEQSAQVVGRRIVVCIERERASQ